MSQESSSVSLDTAHSELLDAFRSHYADLEQWVTQAMTNATDPVLVARLGDDINAFLALVVEVSFLSAAASIQQIHFPFAYTYRTCIYFMPLN
jgi:hypothetical protein